MLIGLCSLKNAIILFFYFSYWGPNEPNGNGNEDCVEIKYYDLENSWNDEECKASHFWICEKKVSL